MTESGFWECTILGSPLKETVGDGFSSSNQKGVPTPEIDAQMALPEVPAPHFGLGYAGAVSLLSWSLEQVVVANIGDSRALLIRDGKAACRVWGVRVPVVTEPHFSSND